jgi:hypothetical protein
MANNQFGFRMTKPANAYGNTVSFNVPNGIVGIARNSTGKWATGGNLVALRSAAGGEFVECSITYSDTGGPKPQGWYFWYAWSGNIAGTYVSLGYDPTGHNIRLDLSYRSSWGVWKAKMYDSTSGVTKGWYTISGPSAWAIASSWIMFEAGDNPTCVTYSPLGSGIFFNNMWYYDINGGQIVFTPSAGGTINNSPPTCSVCINENTSNLQVSYHGC